MPNWCYNNLEIRLLNENIINALKLSLDNEVMFEFLCPLDLGIDIAGKPKWDHDVALAKWGTKWDVSSLRYKYNDVDKIFCLNFDTAWLPPGAFYQSLMENDDVDLIRASYHEAGMQCLGQYTNNCGTLINNQYNYKDIIPKKLGQEVGLDDYSDEPVFELNADGDYVLIKQKDETV